MKKNDENGYRGQKMLFCGLKKTMMPSESSWDFFTISLRVVRPPIAESFSLTGEGHRKRGRFLVELPANGCFLLKIMNSQEILISRHGQKIEFF
jgi:hypothetical protein